MAKQTTREKGKSSSGEELDDAPPTPEKKGDEEAAEKTSDAPVATTAEPKPAPQPKKAPAPVAAEEEEEEEEDDDEEEDEEGEDGDEETAEDEKATSSAEDADESPAEADDVAARTAEGTLPTQLGVQRYVFSAYLAAAGLLAYVIGRAIHDIWAKYGNKDFFSNNLPRLAAIPDDPKFILNKTSYAFAIGIVISLITMIRLYRKPSVRQWTDDVTSEMAKCRWPNRKEVTSSTIVVIAASAASTAYLFILDRLWSFITSLVYGSGT
jgi:preprotein translocase subunit SecE